jgi:hypothetical protein
VIKGFQTMYRIETKTEFCLIDFEEKNEVPNGYTSLDYESKGFTESKSIQDFPLWGKAVYCASGNAYGAKLTLSFRDIYKNTSKTLAQDQFREWKQKVADTKIDQFNLL